MGNKEPETRIDATEERFNDIEKHLFYQVDINREFFNIFRKRKTIDTMQNIAIALLGVAVIVQAILTYL